MSLKTRAGGLVLAFCIVALVRADEIDAAKQEAEIQAKIAELQKKLDELKKGKTPAGKKPLTLADTAAWRSIRGMVLSGDGKWFAHRVAPMEGEGDVVLRSIADGKETKFPGGGGFGSLEFSFDSKWFAFTVSPPPPKPGTPPSPGPRPKTKVVLVNLANNEKTEFEAMQSFQFSGESATHLAMRKASETPSAPPTGGPPMGPPAAPIPTAASGADLVLRELANGAELVFGNVSEFSFDKKGNWLVMLIDSSGQVGNGVQLRDMKTGALLPVETAKATYSNLAWNRDRNAFTVLKGVEDKAIEGKWHSLVAFSELGPKPTKIAYDPKGDSTFPKEMGISTNRPAMWNEDLSAITFGIAEQKAKKDEAKKDTPKKDDGKKDEPKKDEAKKDGPPAAKKDAGGAKPDLVIWHWKDERLQPMQEKQSGFDKTFTYLASYRVKDKKFVRLADEGCRSVLLGEKSKYAIGQDVKPYQYMGNLDGRRYADVYAIEPESGKRTKMLTKARYVFGTNPAGTHLLHYNDGHFFLMDLATGKSVNITEKVTDTKFIDTDDDHNIDKPPTRPQGWSKDGKYVILNDDWDLWKIAADGSGGESLTGNGKKDGIRYGLIMQFEPEPRDPGIDFSKPAFVTMYGEWTKKSGYAKWEPNKSGVTPLIFDDASVSGLNKARNAEVYSYSRGTCIDYPEVYLTNETLKDAKKATTTNPKQANFAWCSGAKLVDYVGIGGKKMQGALWLPANYEPGKKYPTIVYIYEKLSQSLHQYSPPAAGGGGFNRSMYTSNGYAVFSPDIAYRLNDPGVSAVECVLPAIDAAIATGIVDGDKLGLQGHSWGGYQTSFLVTATNRFKAAVAGAPLTDLISMYSSMYWNTGSANQPIFESSQGRFTGGYWSQQEAYIRNSPVFQATKVTTPLVILHNDKDGAVDFVQGIEYYNTLRRLQKPVVMLQYKGENHGLMKPENQKDYAVRMREFFDHYLQGKPAPDWWVEGVPYSKMDEHLKKRTP
jgi:dipeptidyl aminopeptidase/acylaminoacyl peptidase